MRHLRITIVLSSLAGCGYPWDVLFDGPGGAGGPSSESDSEAGPTSDAPSTGPDTDDVDSSDPMTGVTTGPDATTEDTGETNTTTDTMTGGPELCALGPDLPEEKVEGLDVESDALELASNGDVLLLAHTLRGQVDLGGVCEAVSGAFVAAFDRCTLACKSSVVLEGWSKATDIDVASDSVVIVGEFDDKPAIMTLSEALEPIEGGLKQSFEGITEVAVVAIGSPFINVAGRCGTGLGVALLDDSLNVLGELCAAHSGPPLSISDIAVRDDLTAVTGSYSENILFGGVIPTLAPGDMMGTADNYVVTVSGSPDSYEWQSARRIGGTGQDSPGALAITSDRVLVTGQVQGSSVVPEPVEDCPCDPDAFVATFNQDLLGGSLRAYGTNLPQHAHGIALAGDVPVFVGSFEGGAFEGGGSVGTQTGFLAFLDPVTLEVTEFEQFDGHATVRHVATDAHGVVVAGFDEFFLQTLTLDP